MNFLIVEDGSEKMKDLQQVLIDERFSFQAAGNEREAKLKLRNNIFDMILLDMELPCSGNNVLCMNKFSGITIMNSMRCYNIDTPVLIITQYVNFVDMETMMTREDRNEFCRDDARIAYNNLNLYTIKFLEQLNDFMSERYPNYIGSIHYSNVNNEWKNELIYFIEKIGGKKNAGFSS